MYGLPSNTGQKQAVDGYEQYVAEYHRAVQSSHGYDEPGLDAPCYLGTDGKPYHIVQRTSRNSSASSSTSMHKQKQAEYVFQGALCLGTEGYEAYLSPRTFSQGRGEMPVVMGSGVSMPPAHRDGANQ